MTNCKHDDCIYAVWVSKTRGDGTMCGYCYLTGAPRGCPVKGCTRYVPRNGRNWRKAMRVKEV